MNITTLPQAVNYEEVTVKLLNKQLGNLEGTTKNTVGLLLRVAKRGCFRRITALNISNHHSQQDRKLK